MKLYLSSQGFGNHLDRLKDMVGSDRRVLFVDNAKDYYLPSDRAAHVAEKKAEFEAEGFEFFELDLRNYFRSPDKLKPIIDAANFIFVFGGNTFVLRRAFAYSGFDTLLTNALKNNPNLVYAGSSAGSIIMTQTLHGTEHGDDPYVVPDGYEEEILWDGLGLIYPQLIPHYGSDSFEGSAAMEEYFRQNGHHYETLRDGEVYLVDGKYEEKLT